MSMSAAIVLLALATAGDPPALDVGPVDRPRAPGVETLRPPKEATGVPVVGLRAEIRGQVPETTKSKYVYLLVNPLSNPDTNNHWWVQEPIVRDGKTIMGSCQFGEVDAGANEYFVVVAIASDTEYTVGERLVRLPRGIYSRPLIVKRRD